MTQNSIIILGCLFKFKKPRHLSEFAVLQQMDQSTDSNMWKRDCIHMLTFFINLFNIQLTFMAHLFLPNTTLDALDLKVDGTAALGWFWTEYLMSEERWPFSCGPTDALRGLSGEPSCWMSCPLHCLHTSSLLVSQMHCVLSHLWVFKQVFSAEIPLIEEFHLSFGT